MGSASMIATVYRGTTTYTDVEYAYTSSYTNDLLFYDVKGYYSIEGTSSDDNYVSVFGKLDIQPESKKTEIDALLTVAENSLDNYLNPFNNYTIPDNRGWVCKFKSVRLSWKKGCRAC